MLKNKRITLLGLLFTLVLASQGNALDVEKLRIDGTYLGLFNMIQEGKKKSTQFDFAANLDLNYQISDRITGAIQFQMARGESRVGLANPQLVVTDLNMRYEHPNGWALTLGSFDTPLGEEELSNNADTFSNPFFFNSLLYSGLTSSPLSTLNTLGLMVEIPTDIADTALAITNGTSETAKNDGNQFEYIARIISKDFLNTHIGATYLSSDDKNDNAGLQSKFSAELINLESQPINSLDLRGYTGTLHFDDTIATIWMIESVFTPTHVWHIGSRYSAWETTADLTAIVNPGLSLAPRAGSVHRLQLNLQYALEDNLIAKIEGVWDDYKNGDDINGVVLALNGKF